MKKLKMIIATSIICILLTITNTSAVFATSFTDVFDGSWYAESVEYVNKKGYMTGKSESIFDPTGNLRREEMALVIYRIAGTPKETFNSCFADVKKTNTAYSAICWGKKNNILKGHADGYFRPKANISRQDFILILYRFAEYMGYNACISDEMETYALGKADYNLVSKYAQTAIKWGAGYGFIGNNSLLKPLENISRAEAATIITRFTKEYIDNQTAHFSIDDCNSILADITNNNYSSLFEQSTFGYLKKLHDRYGLTVTLYLYYQRNGFTLDKVTERYREEFKENADWLKFGFHAIDSNAYTYINTEVKKEVTYYNKTINAIKRFTGTDKTIDRFIRLDRFDASAEIVASLSSTAYGIKGLYAPDYSKNVFGFGSDIMKKMRAEDMYTDANGILYVPTDMRLENMNSTEKLKWTLSDHLKEKYITVFTHEWKMGDETILNYIELVCKELKNRNISWGFILAP